MSASNVNRTSSLISTKYMLISLGLSVIGMAVVIWWTYSPGVLDHLRLKRMPGLVLAVAVTLLRVVFVAAKIRFLAEGALSWMASFRVALTWDFASAVTPSTIGGAPVATYAMSREGIKLGKSTAIILYGVLLDQFWYAVAVPILLIGGIWLDVIPPEIGFIGSFTMMLIYAGLLLYGAVLAYGLLVNPTFFKRLVHLLFRIPLLSKYRRRAADEAQTLESYSYELKKKSASFILKAFTLSTMAWLARVAVPVIVILSLLPADEVMLVFRSLAMNLASLVIPTPGGSGGVEGLFAIFLGPLIERTAFIGLAVFLWRVITYYISIGLGVIATTWYVNHKMEEITSRSDDEREEVPEMEH